MHSVILSTSYLPPIQYVSKFILYENIFIENDENYNKQTFRNRCEIFGANGRQILSIPVKLKQRLKWKIKDVKIDYSMNWQKNHWKSIESAYKNSPFFEYYHDEFLPFFKLKYDYLVDYNNEILNIILYILEIIKTIRFSDSFQKDIKNADDYRYTIQPKAFIKDDKYTEVKYTQVFGTKHGFIPNLSIIDLIFNEGPNSIDILHASLKK